MRFSTRRRRLAALAGTAIFALAFSVTPALADSGGRDLTCAGGSITPGAYDSVTITGFCSVDAGSTTVRHDLVVKAGAALIAAYGNSNVTVRHDLKVEKNGVLALGCGLPSSACFDGIDRLGACARSFFRRVAARPAIDAWTSCG